MYEGGFAGVVDAPEGAFEFAVDAGDPFGAVAQGQGGAEFRGGGGATQIGLRVQRQFVDLFGPSRIMSFGGSYYALVIVDDYSRYTWTLFITHKNDAFQAFRKLAKIIQNKKNLKIISIRSDHGGEFENKEFEIISIMTRSCSRRTLG